MRRAERSHPAAANRSSTGVSGGECAEGPAVDPDAVGARRVEGHQQNVQLIGANAGRQGSERLLPGNRATKPPFRSSPSRRSRDCRAQPPGPPPGRADPNPRSVSTEASRRAHLVILRNQPRRRLHPCRRRTSELSCAASKAKWQLAGILRSQFGPGVAMPRTLFGISKATKEAGMKTGRFRSTLGMALCAALLASAAWAQSKTTSALTGTVTDESGAAIPGATVEISSPSLIGGARTSVTEENGRFRFPEIAPGIYSVSVASRVSRRFGSKASRW